MTTRTEYVNKYTSLLQTTSYLFEETETTDGDLSKDPEEYQMLVHLFGAASFSSCANFALIKTAEDNETSFDLEVIDIVKKNFYVDDCLKTTVALHSSKT
jgi:hypothetical protein